MESTVNVDGAIWYYERNGTRVGPLTRTAVEDLFHKAEIDGDTLVWEPNLGSTWRRLSDLNEFRKQEATPPPLPATHVNNSIAWFLALVPLIGYAVEHVVSDAGVRFTDSKLFLGYWIANIVLCSIDLGKIKAAGRSGRTLQTWAVLLVPVYLYKRARFLNQPLHYFWVWIAAFVLSTAIETPGLFTGDVYWGVGLPSCDSGTATKFLVKNFETIPLIKLTGVAAVDVENPKEQSHTEKNRTCSAMVKTTAGTTVPVRYTITQRDNEYWIQMDISN